MKAKRQEFPEHGIPWDQLDAELTRMLGKDPGDVRGRLCVYGHKGSPEIQEVVQKAYLKYFKYNGILSSIFPSLSRMENEIKEMVLDLFNGTEEGAVNLTSGGSESIYCGLHAARNLARETRPEVKEPEVLAPYSVHPAFTKGCELLGLELVRVPLGKDYRADVKRMASSITPNTIALAGSAPCWPYGLFDPIEDIAALAAKHQLWMHVDACVGGYLTPFMHQLGVPIPRCDLSTPGVQSISADLHKFGYAAKPCSTIIWRSADLQRFHYHKVEDWPSGPYLAESFIGSRPGAAIASAWAVMKFLGNDGYLDIARKYLAVKDKLIEGIRRIGVYDIWPCELAVQTFGSNRVSLGKVVAGMKAKGWLLMGTREPPLILLNLDAVSDEVTELFLKELSEVTNQVLKGTLTDEGKLSYH